MKKIKVLFYLLFLIFVFPCVLHAQENISYQTHVQDYGWQNYVSDGSTSGTSGESKRLEAIIIKLNNSEYSGNILYQTHIQDIGWQNYVSQGNISGTSGQSKRLEGIRIKLNGKISLYYDVYYRVHVQNIGWQGWVKNGEMAGTSGKALRLEAIEIKLEKRQSIPIIEYQTYVQDIGWQDYVENNQVSGTSGQSKKIEAFQIIKSDDTLKGKIFYQSYVQGVGWQKEVPSSTISGTSGQSKRIEAIKIWLTDDLDEKYDVYYRVHVQNIGWLDWAKNGEKSGTVGYNYRIEALQINMIEKTSNPNYKTYDHYREKKSDIYYSSHVQDIGWQNYVSENKTSGTSGQSKRIEAFKIKFSNETDNNFISYRAHVQDIGWQNWVSNNNISGTIGKSKKIEALQIKLSGDIDSKYDIYYRVHVQNVGWLDWAKNGEMAGTSGQGLQIEAMQIVLIEKGGKAPGLTSVPYRQAVWKTDSSGNRYFYDIYGNLVTNSITINDITHYFGPTGIYLGTGKLRVIDVSHHQGRIDWNEVTKSGIYGVILRIGYWKTEDSWFKYYIEDVKKYNIPYGIYLFSYASTANGANIEADFTNKMIHNYNLNPTLGIYYDLEDWYTSTETSDSLSKEQYDVISSTYINNVSNYVSNRYKVKVYGDLNHANNRYGSYTRSQVDWIAQYNSSCSYTGKYSLWQFTYGATLNGINGNVDMSYLYK